MEERHRDDGFEATFVVSTPRPQAWKMLTEARPGVRQDSRARTAAVVDPRRRRRRRRDRGGARASCCASARRPSRAREPRSWSPWRTPTPAPASRSCSTASVLTSTERRPWLEAGWWAIRADLWVFFEHGVAAGRHLRPWSSIGCDVAETPGGLTVGAVSPGGPAESAGVQAGDLLLTVAGAPVVNIRELAILARSLRSGAERAFSLPARRRDPGGHKHALSDVHRTLVDTCAVVQLYCLHECASDRCDLSSAERPRQRRAAAHPPGDRRLKAAR